MVDYDRESFEIVYIRDGLDAESFTQRVEQIYDNISQRPVEEDGANSFGKPYAS